MGYSAKSTANVKLEAPFFLAIFDPLYGNATHVVHVHQAAGSLPAAGESDLELPAEALGIGVSQQKLGGGFGVRRYIEDFIAAYAGQGASRDVPDGIAAGFPRRDANGRKPSH